MIKRIWNKIKSALTFNVQQPLIFKMNLIAALVIAAALPVALVTAVLTTTAVTVLNALVLTMILWSSVGYILESIAFRPDRYVHASDYNHARAIVHIAEIHRKAMVDAIKKMKASKVQTELANILGVDLTKKL